MSKTNKWGKWYLSEDEMKLVCQIKNYAEFSIDLSSCQTEEQRKMWIRNLSSPHCSYRVGGALRKIDHDTEGLKKAFNSLYSWTRYSPFARKEVVK